MARAPTASGGAYDPSRPLVLDPSVLVRRVHRRQRRRLHQRTLLTRPATRMSARPTRISPRFPPRFTRSRSPTAPFFSATPSSPSNKAEMRRNAARSTTKGVRHVALTIHTAPPPRAGKCRVTSGATGGWGGRAEAGSRTRARATSARRRSVPSTRLRWSQRPPGRLRLARPLSCRSGRHRRRTASTGRRSHRRANMPAAPHRTLGNGEEERGRTAAPP